MNKKIILTIILKLLGVGLTYLLLPLLLKNIGMERYGIWVLLISIFTWVNNFDFGIGSSLKNKVSEKGEFTSNEVCTTQAGFQRNISNDDLIGTNKQKSA